MSESVTNHDPRPGDPRPEGAGAAGNGSTNGHAAPAGLGDAMHADRHFEVDHRHHVCFTRDVFAPDNHLLRDLLRSGPDPCDQTLVFVDDGVARAWPDLPQRIAAFADAHADVMHLAGDIEIVPGGEQAKNGRGAYENALRAIHDAGLCRHSYVIVIGGGAVLDAIGFAAATAHRGVRHVRLPTTTLAQDDAGVGVKNGINAFGKKNFLGCFAVPWAVINDETFLATLTDRDWRSGLSEAVKVALLKDAAFFRQIESTTGPLAARDEAAAIPIIRRSAELHLAHITEGGDPFELLNARPLDFGHWSAHKLEDLSGYRIRHGEAVAIGVALDTVYSMLTGRLAAADAARVLDCLTRIGFVLYDDVLAEHEAVLDGLEEFREHLGGRLTITLLEGIGRAVDVHEIDPARVIEAIHRLADHAPADATPSGAG